MYTPALIDAFGIKSKPSLPPIKYEEVLMFNDVIRHVSSSNFNASSSMFTVPVSHLETGLYWMHFGIEIPSNASSRFSLGRTSLYIEKQFLTSTAPTTLSKSSVLQLKPNTSESNQK